MTSIGPYDAKTHLADLLTQIPQGKTTCITKRGRPVAELRPVTTVVNRLRFGCDKGRVIVRTDFDSPVPGFACH